MESNFWEEQQSNVFIAAENVKNNIKKHTPKHIHIFVIFAEKNFKTHKKINIQCKEKESH